MLQNPIDQPEMLTAKMLLEQALYWGAELGIVDRGTYEAVRNPQRAEDAGRAAITGLIPLQGAMSGPNWKGYNFLTYCRDAAAALASERPMMSIAASSAAFTTLLRITTESDK